MKWQDVVKKMEGLDRILVVGPARSGTRITSVILADALKKKHYQEEIWHTYEYRDKGERPASGHFRVMNLAMAGFYPEQYVLHAPMITPTVHRISDRRGLGVVYVIRDQKDWEESHRYVASKRPWENPEEMAEESIRDWYGFYNSPPSGGNLIKVALDFWLTTQKPTFAHAHEMEFASIRNHPWYVPKHRRRSASEQNRWVDSSTEMTPI